VYEVHIIPMPGFSEKDIYKQETGNSKNGTKNFASRTCNGVT
jgi:hypothetical protein